DEVGNHHLKSSDDENQRYLGLCCAMMRLDYADGDFTRKLDALKVAVFGTTQIVLHRRELLPAKPPFEVLDDADKRKEFDELLLDLLRTADYLVITVVIDKQEHLNKYKLWRHHAYHYCLQVAMERYIFELEARKETGDVLVES